MKNVKFGMEWKCYGHQEITLPDDVDADDMDAVIAYIKSKWDEIPIPEGDYIGGSDVLDEDFIEIYG